MVWAADGLDLQLVFFVTGAGLRGVMVCLAPQMGAGAPASADMLLQGEKTLELRRRPWPK